MRARFGITLAGALASLLLTGAPLRAQSTHVVIGGSIAFGSPPPPAYPAGPQAYPPVVPYPGNRGWDRNDRGSYAYSTGYRDGFDQGRDDARDRHRYDVRRHRRYRNGDHGYHRDLYMSKRQYEDIYRRGFLAGYDAGYRDGWRGGRYDPRDQYRDRDDHADTRGRFWFFWKR